MQKQNEFLYQNVNPKSLRVFQFGGKGILQALSNFHSKAASSMNITITNNSLLGSQGGTVLSVHASHHCDPGSIPAWGICGVSYCQS